MRNLPVYRSFSKSPYKSIKHSSYFDVYEKGLSNINIEINNYNEGFKAVRGNYGKSEGVVEDPNGGEPKVVKIDKIQKELKKPVNDIYTVDQALRVYLWDMQGSEIPGISKEQRLKQNYKISMLEFIRKIYFISQIL